MNPPPFILVADRRTLKVFSCEGGSERLRLVNAIAIADIDESTPATRLSRDGFAKQAACHMARLLKTYQPERWAFAAPPEVNGAILDELSPKWLSTLQDNLPRDLNHEAPRNLTKLFQRPLN
jgi:hypothetical protein